LQNSSLREDVEDEGRKTVEGRLYRRMRDVSYFGAQPK
jgi:hypothetical protein